MGFTYSNTDWAGWTYNGEVSIQNNSKSMLIYTNDTSRNQYITSVSIRMGSGSGTFSYTDSSGVTHSHNASGKTYSAYMYGTGSDGVQVTSNTQDCSNLVTKSGSTYNGLKTKTFTFEPGIYVTPKSSVTLYMYFTMAAKYATVVAYKYDYSATAKNIYTLTLNTSTGVASFTGGGSFVEGTAAPSTATASSGYTLSKYVGTLYDGSGDSEWTECAGLTTHNDSWPMHADRNVTAYASANTYNLTLNPNGGAFSNGSTSATTADPKLIYHGSNWYDVSGYTPTRAGYTFAGWYTSVSGGTKVYNANGACVAGTSYWNNYNAYVYAGDLTVYARWTPILYTITYDANGGSTVAAQTYTIETNLSIAGASSKTGHTFSLWKVQANSGNWTANATYEASKNIGTGHYGNITLVANWNVNNYTLTVNKGTGINAVSGGGTKAYGANCSISATANAGYTFSHWLYKNINVSTSNPYTFTMPAGNQDYTAVGIGNTYYIKYDPNGGTGSMANSTHQYGIFSNLTKNTFNKVGYEFKGWATSSTATSAIYNDEHSIATLTTVNEETITLYAVWAQDVFTITTGAEGSYIATVNGGGNYSYGDTCTIEAIYPEGCGYEFDYFIKDDITTITTNPYNEAVTAEARFIAYSKPIQYIISFNSNTGKGSMSSMICTYDTDYPLTSNAFYKDGYQFIGWAASPDATTIVYENGQVIHNLASNNGSIITLYAVWKAISKVYIWAANAAGEYGWRKALKYIYNTQLTSTNTTINVNTTAMSDVNYSWSLASGTSLIASGSYSDGSKNIPIDKAILDMDTVYFTVDKMNALDTITVIDQNGNILSAANDNDAATSYLLTANITTVKVVYETGYYVLSLTSSGENFSWNIKSSMVIANGSGAGAVLISTNISHIQITLNYADGYTYTITESGNISVQNTVIENNKYIITCTVTGDAVIDINLEIEPTTSNLLDEGLLDVMQIF